MRIFSQISQRYEWNIVTKKGKFKGIDVSYDGSVDRNRAFYACAEIFDKYGLSTEIRDMYADLLGIPVEIRDMSIKEFQRKYGERPRLNISFLEVWGKRPSLRAKLCGVLPPYAWFTAGRVTTSLWLRDLNVPTSLGILKELSGELGLDIDTGIIERDIEDFKEIKS